MQLSHRPFRVAVLVLLAVAAFGGPVQAPSEFRGRMFVGGGPNRPGAVNVKVVLDAPTTPEEVAVFMSYLGSGDIEGFYTAFHKSKKGSLQFTGGLGLRVDFYAASETKTEKGTKIVLAGEAKSLETGIGKRTHGSYLFLVVTLDLDDKGTGGGQLYEDGRIAFAADGGLLLETYLTTPKEIVNIKKTK